MTLLRRPWIRLNKSLSVLKFTFHENAQEQFLSSKSDNVSTTFFSDQLDQQWVLFQNLLLGLWHSYVEPQFNWSSPWLRLNSLFMKTHKNKCELEMWQRIKYFLFRPAKSTISSLTEPTRTMTLLRRISIQLNKSLTALKFTFYENAQK